MSRKRNKNRLNNIYLGMKTRCYNPHRHDYKNYGGKGVTVCDEWLNGEIAEYPRTKGWIAFRDWAMNNGYNDSLTLDRIDYNKGYSPDNCRWVSWKVQFNNRSTNRLITYKGKTQTIFEWCKELDLCYQTVYLRMKKGLSLEMVFSKENFSHKKVAI